MPARDKYTVFSPHVEGYRKGIHKVPKFTRVCLLPTSSSSESPIRLSADNTQGEPERLLVLSAAAGPGRVQDNVHKLR